MSTKRFVNGIEYLDLNSDVKQAGLDPLFHFLTYVKPDGPLRENRVIEIEDQPVLPSDFDGSIYIEQWKDVRDAGYTVETAKDHYLQFGYKEGRWPIALPPGFDGAAYVDYWKDVKEDGYTADTAWKHYLLYGYKEGRWPIPGSGWMPPTQSGIVCQTPGGFFMGGCRLPEGLILGTYYRPAPANVYLFDGQFHKELSGSFESYYGASIHNGKTLLTTECYASVVERLAPGQYQDKEIRKDTPLSLAFDILEYKGGLLLYTQENVNVPIVKMYLGDASGNNWRLLKVHQGANFCQCCTDGNTYWLIGNKNGFPYIECEDGSVTLWAKDGWDGQTINYAVIKDGIFSLGCQNIDPIIVAEGKRRNGYLMVFDGKNFYTARDFCDFTAQFVMFITIDRKTGYRYAICSEWDETKFPPELAFSKDGIKWAKICNIPIPQVITIECADDGIYCYGGQYGLFGSVYYKSNY